MKRVFRFCFNTFSNADRSRFLFQIHRHFLRDFFLILVMGKTELIFSCWRSSHLLQDGQFSQIEPIPPYPHFSICAKFCRNILLTTPSRAMKQISIPQTVRNNYFCKLLPYYMLGQHIRIPELFIFFSAIFSGSNFCPFPQISK